MSLRFEFERALRTIGEHGEMLPKRGTYPLMAERDIIILWGTYRGWSRAVMARMLKQGAQAVRRRQLHLMLNPSELFNGPVMTRKTVGSKHIYVCEFCDRTLQVFDEERARQHVASHITTEEVVHVMDVMGNYYENA